MLFPDTKHPWPAKALGEVFRLSTLGLIPQSYPREAFHHFSIPAWDETGGPITEIGKNIESGKLLLSQPCVLVSKLNPHIPRVRVFERPNDGLRSCASTELMPFVPIADETSLAFYSHYFRSDRFQKNLCAAASGTTNSHRRVRPPQTLQWIVPEPPPDEQAAIARILDAVDTAIERTCSAVNKAQELRRSLLAELLSRGINANGTVRQLGKSKQGFTATKLGLLPSDWRLSAVGTEFELQNGFTLNEDRRPKLRKRRYLRVANVQRDSLKLDDVQELEAKDREFAPRSLAKDDLLVVEGHADRMQIGRCARVTDEAVGMTFQNHLFRLRTKGEVLPDFGCLWLNSAYGQRYWNACCATSSGLNTINQRMLKRMVIPVLPTKEQETICACIQAQRTHLESLQTKLTALEQLKKSLMHDLLTGSVRVHS